MLRKTNAPPPRGDIDTVASMRPQRNAAENRLLDDPLKMAEKCFNEAAA